MNIQQYIQSGIIEEYVNGMSSPADKQEFENLLPLYPELRLALYHYEIQVESDAMANSIPPPPALKKITEERINRLPVQRPLFDEPPPKPPFIGTGSGNGSGDNYIPVQEVQDSHIKVHKYWRLVVFIVFLFAKLCLAFMCYFAIQYYHAQSEIKDLRQQIQHISAKQNK